MLDTPVRKNFSTHSLSNTALSRRRECGCSLFQMSGPVDEPDQQAKTFGLGAIEVKEGRHARIGKMGVLRVLPTKQRRTIGPWCFVDLMSPDDIEKPPRLEVGPHPHIGLATVTWLFAGTVLHSDSLGTQQPIRPGELNLMTAGRGIAHAEEGLETQSAEATGGVMGVQMWLAQPNDTRDAGNAFQHVAEVPEVELAGATASLLIGSHTGHSSPASFDHPAIGLDMRLRGPTEIAIDSDFEHGVVPIDRPILVDDAIVEPGSLALVPTQTDSLRLSTQSGPGRVIVLGGLPLGESVKMWWNFVARTTDEITDAWRDWQNHDIARFGPVASGLPRIDAPRPPWLRNSDRP